MCAVVAVSADCWADCRQDIRAVCTAHLPPGLPLVVSLHFSLPAYHYLQDKLNLPTEQTPITC